MKSYGTLTDKVIYPNGASEIRKASIIAAFFAQLADNVYLAELINLVMTDKEIIDGLINRDNRITYRLFFVTARPLLTAIMRRIFDAAPDYNEIVNELYAYLIDNDCAKLRMFGFQCSFITWLKVVATRYFLRYRKNIVEDVSTDPEMPPNNGPSDDPSDATDSRIDINALIDTINNQRYAMVIRRLILDETPPATLASEMGITIDNLYNIKRRAIAALTDIALKTSRK